MASGSNTGAPAHAGGPHGGPPGGALPPPLQIMGLTMQCWLARAVHTAVLLDVANHLPEGGEKHVRELAVATKSHEESLHRLLRALAFHGYFVEKSPGAFQHTPLSLALRDQGLRAMVLHMGGALYQAWGALPHVVRTGQDGMTHVLGKDCWQLFKENADEAWSFNTAMTFFSRMWSIAQSYDWAQFKNKIVDVGGGEGATLLTIAEVNTTAELVTFDLPEVVAKAPHDNPRLKTVGGSFFESVPGGADAYLLKHILHDWNDEKAKLILQTIRKAIPPTSKLIIADRLVPELAHGGHHPRAAQAGGLDLHMMVVCGGKERNESQWKALLHSAGFKLHVPPQSNPAAFIDVLEGFPI